MSNPIVDRLLKGKAEAAPNAAPAPVAATVSAAPAPEAGYITAEALDQKLAAFAQQLMAAMAAQQPQAAPAAAPSAPAAPAPSAPEAAQPYSEALQYWLNHREMWTEAHMAGLPPRNPTGQPYAASLENLIRYGLGINSPTAVVKKWAGNYKGSSMISFILAALQAEAEMGSPAPSAQPLPQPRQNVTQLDPVPAPAHATIITYRDPAAQHGATVAAAALLKPLFVTHRQKLAGMAGNAPSAKAQRQNEYQRYHAEVENALGFKPCRCADGWQCATSNNMTHQLFAGLLTD